MSKAKEFFGKCRRVWFTMRKPTKQEFETVAKISAIGILVIGLFGFLVSVLMKVFS